MIERNSPCPCGSGKKYKKCCYGKDNIIHLDSSKHNKSFQLNLTQEEVKTLSDLVFLGGWIKYAHTIGITPERVKYFDVEQKIHKILQQTQYSNLVATFDEDDSKTYPIRKYEEKLHEDLDEYNNEVFWEEFQDRLVERDMEKEYGIKKLRKMDGDEVYELEEPFREKYAKEFGKNGISNFSFEKK